VRGYFPGALPRRAHYLTPGQPGYLDVLGKIAPEQGSGQPEAALAALSAAGFTGSGGTLQDRTGTTLPELRLRYPERDAVMAAAAEVLRAQLRRIGLRSVQPAHRGRPCAPGTMTCCCG
jgi:ABC-type transport system substrate-binding protein